MNYSTLLEQNRKSITEIMPWDLQEYNLENSNTMIIDVRETHEYEQIRIDNSISVPRGILENACSWDFTETIPEFASAIQRPILLICRSGNRSVFAAISLQQLGFKKVTSLKLGIKGLNDEDFPLFDQKGKQVDANLADKWLTPDVSAQQRKPAKLT